MGLTVSADVFGPKGFFDTFMPGNAKPELLVDGFGEPLRMLELVERLDTLPDVAEIMDIARCDGRPA